jgi:uncharacterized protein (TIGR02588 family)
VAGAEQDRRHTDRTENGARRRRVRESRLQIVVSWLAGLLLLGVVGYLVWEGTRTGVPAAFEARIEPVRESEDLYYLPLTVTNTGGESVQGLGVSLELFDGDTIVERSSATIDWLPEGSSRQVVVILDRDPRRYRPVVGFEGYQVP